MSIKSKSVRSVVAFAFVLSGLFVWNHQRTSSTELQVSVAKECYSMNGHWVCP